MLAEPLVHVEAVEAKRAVNPFMSALNTSILASTGVTRLKPTTTVLTKRNMLTGEFEKTHVESKALIDGRCSGEKK